MSEADAIASADRPATQATIVTDLRALGVEPGMTLMVHSSLSKLGFVAGGPQAVVQALLEALGPAGTLMMPTHSTGISDPAAWSNPPVPEAWWQTIRDEMSPYDPALSPTRGMGAIVECFRHVDGLRRSAHPCVSAAAVGPNAGVLVDDHPLAHGLGEPSPQARLYDLDGHILLLGVTHSNNTSLHLAEYRFQPMEIIQYSSAITVDGERRWCTYDSIEEDEEDFAELGEAFAATGAETQGPVGAGTGRLMRAREVVDFGVEWMREHRGNA